MKQGMYKAWLVVCRCGARVVACDDQDLTKRQAEARVRSRGWRLSGAYGWLCPECSEKARVWNSRGDDHGCG